MWITLRGYPHIPGRVHAFFGDIVGIIPPSTGIVSRLALTSQCTKENTEPKPAVAHTVVQGNIAVPVRERADFPTIHTPDEGRRYIHKEKKK